jgi:hypothetical protein
MKESTQTRKKDSLEYKLSRKCLEGKKQNFLNQAQIGTSETMWEATGENGKVLTLTSNTSQRKKQKTQADICCVLEGYEMVLRARCDVCLR